MLLYWLFDTYRSGRSKNCQNCVATPFDVLGTVRSHDAGWNIVHNDCFNQCIACDDTVLCFWSLSQFCCFSVVPVFVSGLWWGGGMGAVESWITVTQRLRPTVRQRGNKNWNNLQDRHVCPPNCALTCKRLFWFAVRVCAVRYLCLSPYPWLTPSKCFGARSSPCPLVFPAMSHVTSPTFALLVCLLAPCICFCSFLFFAVSLRPGDGLPSPPHNTVGCAKVMMNHIPPTRCLKTKINTNADFHTPNHAVQHGAGFTSQPPQATQRNRKVTLGLDPKEPRKCLKSTICLCPKTTITVLKGRILKCDQNLAPALVIIWGNSLVFLRKIITSTGFYRCCAPTRQHH